MTEPHCFGISEWGSYVSQGFFHVYDLKSILIPKARHGSARNVAWYCWLVWVQMFPGPLTHLGWVCHVVRQGLAMRRRLQMVTSFPDPFRGHIHTHRGPHSAVPVYFPRGMVGESECENKRRHCRSSSHRLPTVPAPAPVHGHHYPLGHWRSEGLDIQGWGGVGGEGMWALRRKKSEKWCWMVGHFQIYLRWSWKLIFFLKSLKAHLPLPSEKSAFEWWITPSLQGGHGA